ncbi:MAG: F0F1 ATP synthase subunit gamma, partial [Verrucomicrobia bacterium]|nr:F0F1 ATP synthase subunit gamma [Verrucomicrobiota bacterium]
MEQLRQLEQQLATIDELRDIIHAMRSLAAIYLKQAESQLRGVRAYADAVTGAIADALRALDEVPETPSQGPTCIVLIGSEQGLCGRFNEIVAEAGIEHARRFGDAAFIVVGRRASANVERAGGRIVSVLNSNSSPEAAPAVIRRVAREAFERYTPGELRDAGFRRVVLVHATYLSPGRIGVRLVPILPLDYAEWRPKPGEPTKPRPAMTLEARDLLASLVEEFYFIALYRAFVESL